MNLTNQEISESRYQSIETLASVIANFALDSHFAVSPWPHSISVTVRKPNALPFASAAGITIERSHRARVRTLNGGDEVYIALGSNLGDRLGNFDKALKMLQKEGLEILDVSGLYESEPMYVEEQPRFLNAVCKVLSRSCRGLMLGTNSLFP
jgi:dihydroneopterin aldolase/2-amino-4-hydroxy-6-hydroxymethyldihydropteridine diphosphokinase/dihydropteroate synthase